MLLEKAVEKKKKLQEKPAVIVNGLTKEFIIPHERKTTLFENIKGVFQPSTYEKFTALKDVSFTVERGESVGIIGDNGSGKSTLLKLIANIIRPTRGTIKVNGRITPFLELGVGFQQDMTARENIEVYSTMMGLSNREIRKNMDSVLEFAGLTKFADTKYKNFSSGMQVRLAFATAIQKEPDILLIDEVLAVGDMDFQQKCLDVFTEYKKKCITMLFVSHDLNSVRKFCDKAILLGNGRVIAHGNINDAIDKYVYGVKIEKKSSTENLIVSEPAQSAVSEPKNEAIDNARSINRGIDIYNVQLVDKFGRESNRFNSGDPLVIKARYRMNEQVENPAFGIEIINEKGDNCYGANNKLRNISFGKLDKNGLLYIKIPELPVLSGKYYITIAVTSWDLGTIYDWHNKKYSFDIINNTSDVGVIMFNCNFEVTSKDMPL
jgi:lipopolysaccharide transport system ATP-binding protein